MGTSVSLNVKVNDTAASFQQEFNVVAPQHIGTVTVGGIIGTRSAFGAMVIDSMILGGTNTTYTLDLANHDQATPGNAGYLPAIILSEGPISVQQSVTLSASAVGRDAGPGGGGGGGRGAITAVHPHKAGTVLRVAAAAARIIAPADRRMRITANQPEAAYPEMGIV